MLILHRDKTRCFKAPCLEAAAVALVKDDSDESPAHVVGPELLPGQLEVVERAALE